MAEIPILLVIAALAGAGLNVARGALNTAKEDFSYRKAFGGLIGAGIAALAATAIFDLATLGGTVQTVVLGLITGFNVDFVISKLKK